MNKEERLENYFYRLAKESFNLEGLIYNKIPGNPYTSIESLYEKIITESNFRSYQENLQKAIYGENVVWIKYLYDNKVIKQIVSTGESKIKELYKLENFHSKDYLAVSKIRGKRGIILKSRLDKEFKEIGKTMAKNFSESLSKKGMNNSPVFKTMVSEIESAIVDGLKGKTFRMKVRSTDVKTEDTLDELATMIVERPIYEISATDEGEEQVFSITADVREILLTQKELISIISDSTGGIIKKYKESLGISYTTAESTFTETLKFISGSDLLKSKDSNDEAAISDFVQNNAEEIAERFLDAIVSAIRKVTQDSQIDKIWSYKDILVQMIYEDPHLAQEIYKVNTEASASGTIGEIMFAALLGKMKTEEESVKILGQELTDTGSAAVDIKLEQHIKKAIKKVGFQIKNYSSISDQIVLYSQANKFYDQNSMIRYIENSYLKDLYTIANKIFIDRKMPIDSDKAEAGDYFNEMENILAQSIPNYIRYDQADLDTETFGKNNFYIINFNFIPASIIFYILYKSIQEQENYLKQQKVFFFQGMSGAKARGLLETESDSLIQSWDDSWVKIRDNYIGFENYLVPYTGESGSDVPDIWKDNLYLNFKGIQIKFKQNLNFLWSKAKQG